MVEDEEEMDEGMKLTDGKKELSVLFKYYDMLKGPREWGGDNFVWRGQQGGLGPWNFAAGAVKWNYLQLCFMHIVNIFFYLKPACKAFVQLIKIAICISGLQC